MLQIAYTQMLQRSHAFELRNIAPYDLWEDHALGQDNQSGK